MIYQITDNRRFAGGFILFLALCLVGCRTPQQFKEQADQEVYQSIDNKWQPEFGDQANYKISDTIPSPNDIQVEKALPPSGVLGLTDAVTLATAYNRQYQLEKENLYLAALELTSVKHQYAPNHRC